MIRAGRAGRLLATAALLAFGLLPIADWIPGGHSFPDWHVAFSGWWSGTLIALGLGVILALCSARAPLLWRREGWHRFAERVGPASGRRAAVVACAAALLYAVAARVVFGGRPLLIDEIISEWQARVYASGRLWLPSTGHPELWGAMNLVDHGGRVFGQFPAGGPAMLALGVPFGAEWLVGPLFAALGVWWWGATLRRTGEPASVAAGAFLLLAFAPFALFMSATAMNHVTALAWILAGIAGLATVTATEREHPAAALWSGLAFGMAGTIRPVDALAFGAPAGLWLFWRALRHRRHALTCAAMAAGMAIPLALLLWVNARTTGHPLVFGYTLLWGPDHELGFHAAPWGLPHTPARGLELMNIYLLHLESFFLETPFPSLLPALAVIAFGRRFTPFDRYLAMCGAVVLGCYWAYWHNGFYLGPRFLYPLLPLLALLTARFGAVLGDRWGAGSLPVRAWTWTAVVGGGIAIAVAIPARVREYRYAARTGPPPLEAIAEAAGVKDALVLVRESWGAQVIARMWGLGLTRSEADHFYHHTDLCRLSTTVDSLGRAGAGEREAVRALRPLTADSLRLVSNRYSPDITERIRPDLPPSPGCVARVAEDRRGFTLYPPTLDEGRSGSVYIRDLQARDTIALARYPERPLFLLAPDDTTLGAPVRYHPVRRDSLLASWGLPPDWGR